MKKLILLVFLVQLFSQVNAQKVPSPRKELRKTRYYLITGASCFALSTYCSWNAFESHAKYEFDYRRGYTTDLDGYFRTFKRQMYLSAGFAVTGVVLQSIGISKFNNYRDLMNDKITMRVGPSGIGICYSLR